MELNLSRISARPASPGIRPVSQADRLSIKNIIFDFGGVICNIDVRLTKKAFTDLGLTKFDTAESITSTAGLFERLETGTITPQAFRDALKPFFEHPVSDEQLDAAWNALLLDIPEPRIRLLEQLKQRYRIFLLSNSNEIHYMCYMETLRKQFGYAVFEELFEKAWFSWRIGLKKPSPEIFRHVLHDGNLDPAETLFIDDTLVHTEGAEGAGIQAYHLQIDRGEQIMDLFA